MKRAKRMVDDAGGQKVKGQHAPHVHSPSSDKILWLEQFCENNSTSYAPIKPMAGDIDEATNRFLQIRFECSCLCRQINSTAPISLLRLLSGGITPENQKWFIEHCINEPLALHFPRGTEFER